MLKINKDFKPVRNFYSNEEYEPKHETVLHRTYYNPAWEITHDGNNFICREIRDGDVIDEHYFNTFEEAKEFSDLMEMF